MGSREGCISPDNSSSESYESVSTYSFEEEDMSCSTENAQPSSVKIAPEERSSHSEDSLQEASSLIRSSVNALPAAVMPNSNSMDIQSNQGHLNQLINLNYIYFQFFVTPNFRFLKVDGNSWHFTS